MLFHSISNGIVIFDKDANIIDANDHFLRKLSMSKNELIGLTIRDLFPQDRCGDLCQTETRILIEAFETGKTTRIEDIREGRWYSNTFFPIMQNGKPIAVALVSTDFTDSKLKERVLLENLMLLKEAETLRDNDKRKNNRIGVMVHEMRDPLATASTGIALLKCRLNEKQEHLHLLDVIEKSLRQTNNLVEDLLDITKLTQNIVRLDKVEVNLNKIVSTTIANHMALFDQKGLRLTLINSCGDLYIKADPKRMMQILNNLLSNALKFSSEGGNVTVNLTSETEAAIIRVIDEGIGIAAETKTRIFEPFFQDNSVLNCSISGLGVGLYVVKSLSELHGGSVSVLSEGLGKGAEFVVRLPLKIDAENTIPPF